MTEQNNRTCINFMYGSTQSSFESSSATKSTPVGRFFAEMSVRSYVEKNEENIKKFHEGDHYRTQLENKFERTLNNPYKPAFKVPDVKDLIKTPPPKRKPIPRLPKFNPGKYSTPRSEKKWPPKKKEFVEPPMLKFYSP